MSDAYQERYLVYRERKTALLGQEPRLMDGPLRFRTAWKALTQARRSCRLFVGAATTDDLLRPVWEAARLAPQSCNRQALKLKLVRGSQIRSLLCGGRGWLERAPFVALIFADLAAYKSPAEVAFMPWLDAGVALAAMTYAATACGLASCIVNPKIEPRDELVFRSRFNREGLLFCGALALGLPGAEPVAPGKKPLDELLEDCRDND